MGYKISFVHQNGREISSVKLTCGGTWDSFEVDLFATRDKRYGTSICGSGKFYAGKNVALFFLWKTENPPSIVVTLSTFAVKKAVMELHNPVASAAEKYTSSLRASYRLINIVTSEREISNADHLLAVKEDRWEGKKDRDDANEVKLRGIFNDKGDFDKSL